LTSVSPPNANGSGMEGESEMMTSSSSVGEVGGVDARPSLVSARKTSEEEGAFFFSFLIIFLGSFYLSFFLGSVMHIMTFVRDRFEE